MKYSSTYRLRQGSQEGVEIPSSPWMHPAEKTVVWHFLSLAIDPGLAQCHCGAAACEMRAILYVNNVQAEELIINADCSESKSKQHLAGKTINERVIRELIVQATWRFAGYFLWGISEQMLCKYHWLEQDTSGVEVLSQCWWPRRGKTRGCQYSRAWGDMGWCGQAKAMLM